jgi:disulfide bond formation protein DsbB
MNRNSRSIRLGNLAGLLACAGMMAYALYAQHVLDLEPCPLCVLQRIAVMVLGLLFLAAAVQGPARFGRIVYLVLMSSTVIAGGGVAGRQLWLQSLPPERVPACGPGLDFILDAFPLRDALQMVLTGSGECAKVTWRLLGLSMPGWVLAGLLGLWALAAWNNLRRD